MSIIDELIYDRTLTDVSSLNTLEARIKGGTGTPEDWEAYLGPQKGAYRNTDLNRVAEALLYLAARLTSYGYDVAVSPKSDWTEADIRTSEQLTHYLDDVRTIRAVMEVPPDTPPVPDDMLGLTYQEANDIERILAIVEDTIDHVANAFRRSNAPAFWSGHEPLPT